MDTATQRALLEHTRRFYDDHADAFSRTREHPWPGWSRALAQPAPGARVLDVGCGNGRLAATLTREAAGIAVTGVDSCPALIDHARARRIPGADWIVADVLSDPDAALPPGPFDRVCAFGLLHHVPGLALRRALIAALARRVAPGGRLAVSFWRFAERARFAHRRLDWAALPGIDPDCLEPGDHLLGWGSEGDARYCHASDDREVDALLAGLPLVRVDDFDADGREGDLNHYVVLEAGA